MSDARPPTPVDEIADRYLDRSAAADPVFATFAGIRGYDDRLTDVSPAGHAARASLAAQALAELETAVPVDATDAVTVAALRERLGLNLERHKLGLDLARVNNIESPVQSFRDVFDITASDTDEHWATIGARLRAVRKALGGYRESLDAARGAGWAPAARQVRAASAQARAFGAPQGFFVTFAAAARTAGNRPPRGELPERLRAAAADAAAAYTQLADWLDTEVLPGATDRDAAGRDLYALHAREFLGTVVDLDETYAWGLAELERIEHRMAQVARRVAPDAPGGDDPDAVHAAIAGGIAALDADPARIIDSPQEFRDWMQRLSDQAMVELGNAHFDIPEPVRTLRCRIAPSSSGAVYYTPPSEDFSRPGGRCGGPCPAGMDLVLHLAGGVDGLPRGGAGPSPAGRAPVPQRPAQPLAPARLVVSGHGEGWALYGERLMEELGYLRRTRRLARDARAAARCGPSGSWSTSASTAGSRRPGEVGGGTWDAGKAWGLPAAAHPRSPTPTLRFELERYLGWPGQATWCKVGERAWLRPAGPGARSGGGGLRPAGLPPPLRSTWGSVGPGRAALRPAARHERVVRHRPGSCAGTGVGVRRPAWPPCGPRVSTRWSGSPSIDEDAMVGPVRRHSRRGRGPRAGTGEGRGCRRGSGRPLRSRRRSAATRCSSSTARCTASRSTGRRSRERWRRKSGAAPGVLHTGHWLIDTRDIRDLQDGGSGATLGAVSSSDSALRPAERRQDRRLRGDRRTTRRRGGLHARRARRGVRPRHRGRSPRRRRPLAAAAAGSAGGGGRHYGHALRARRGRPQ